jgi:hypothetical protein
MSDLLTHALNLNKNHHLLNSFLFLIIIKNLLSADNQIFSFKIFIFLPILPPLGHCCPGQLRHIPLPGHSLAYIHLKIISA